MYETDTERDIVHFGHNEETKGEIHILHMKFLRDLLFERPFCVALTKQKILKGKDCLFG